jgi:hypothetical protein
MNADIIQQAAEVIDEAYARGVLGVEWGPYPAAKALADAGLLVTSPLICADNPYPHIDVDAAFERIALERAVLDAALYWADGDRGHLVRGADLRLIDAVDALRNITPTGDA